MATELFQVRSFDRLDTHTPVGSISYTYDDENRLTLEENNNSSARTSYTYDDDGNRLTKEIWNVRHDSDTFQERSSYTYDDEGNPLTEEHHNSDNELFTYTYTYTYTSDGYLCVVEKFDADGTFQERIRYKYDNNGNNTEKAISRGGGVTTIHTYTWRCDY